MKALYWQVVIATLVTFGFLLYNDFKLQAHWAILLFTSLVAVMWLFSFVYNRKSFFQVFFLMELLIFFTKEMFKASFQVAWEVISPKLSIEAGMIAVPLDVKKNLEITILASLISLTPGTLSVEISEDKSYLFVHAMYIPFGDVDKLKAEIKDGFERRVLRVFN
jgi:multicomponent Na+:H+ antiporter subunit E